MRRVDLLPLPRREGVGGEGRSSDGKEAPNPAEDDAARKLRKDQTYPEALLWSKLRAGRFGEVKFRRQHAIGPYIADFYCASAKLAIELDGASHDERAQHDERRTRFIESQGVHVIRFTDDEVLRRLDDVLFRIACEIGIDA